MALQLQNEICCVKDCWSVYEQNSIMNIVRVDYWAAEWVIVTSNDSAGKIYFNCQSARSFLAKKQETFSRKQNNSGLFLVKQDVNLVCTNTKNSRTMLLLIYDYSL